MPPASRPAAASSALPAPPRRLRRRRPLKATLATTPAADAGAAAGAARHGGPETPHLCWAASSGESNANAERPRGDPPSSVRRLAAAVWRLRPPEEAPTAGQYDAVSRVGVEVRALPTPCSPVSSDGAIIFFYLGLSCSRSNVAGS